MIDPRRRCVRRAALPRWVAAAHSVAPIASRAAFSCAGNDRSTRASGSRLYLVFLLALLGCAENRPYRAYVGERAGDAVATITCGIDVRADLRISRVADGTAVYDAATLQSPCGAGLNDVQLDPGEYFISFSACAYKTACDRVFAKVSLLAGHRYGAYGDACFAYMCALEGRSDAPSYQTWAWIEDETAGRVVAGRTY